MIAYLKGDITCSEPTHLHIDIGGVGYEVFISLNTYSAVKDLKKTKLLIHHHIREDAQILYGFFTEEEKELFRLLISISGIGPNTGLMMLSSLNPGEIKAAIRNADVKKIQSVKGIGSKTAQRVIIELKDKIEKHPFPGESALLPTPQNNMLISEALSALVTLGINKGVAEKNVQTVLKTHGDHITLEELIKLALKN
jgi:Holliday junction DNA helicase RuvA